MTYPTRRGFALGALATTAGLAGCSASRIASTRGEIDARVDAALVEMFSTIPGTDRLAQQAVGMLIMPRVNEAGLVGGGTYGEGALMIRGAKVDYYAMAGASLGLQLGAQRYKHALFFMTPESLAGFRAADGWEIGADLEIAVPEKGSAVTITTTTYNKPIYGIIFGQQGLILGASVEGNKYSRIVR